MGSRKKTKKIVESNSRGGQRKLRGPEEMTKSSSEMQHLGDSVEKSRQGGGTAVEGGLKTKRLAVNDQIGLHPRQLQPDDQKPRRPNPVKGERTQLRKG